MPEGAGKSRFPDPSRAADQEMVVVAEPPKGGEFLEQAPVEPARRARVGVLDRGVLAQPDMAELASQALVLACGCLASNQ